MRIAIDVDSTLHHYWDVLSEISMRRFGIDLPYDEQFTWGITRLREDQLALCIEESHTDERIIAGRPYPGAVEAVRAWSRHGHFIQITSNRDDSCAPATAEWLERIGLPFDDLACTPDKVGRCLELGIELLIDDSPHDLLSAVEHQMTAAAILHPWNRDICDVEDIIAAPAWAELALLLEPLLGVAGARSASNGDPASNG